MSDFHFSWERQAANSGPMPDGLPLPEQQAYLAMRMLYLSYDKGIIPRDVAQLEKSRIVANYELQMKKEQQRKKLMDYHVRVIRATELAKAAVRHDPTAENGLKLANALDGLGIPPSIEEE